MGLDLWFREDVKRILASKAQAASRLPDSEYRRGYLDALADVAVSFGILPARAAGTDAGQEGRGDGGLVWPALLEEGQRGGSL